MASKKEATAQKLYDWLIVNQPFDGTRADMAEAIGVTLPHLKAVLYWLRSEQAINVTGWTVLYQQQGSGHHSWHILDIKGANEADINAGVESNEWRRLFHASTIRRTLAQVRVATLVTGGRSSTGRQIRNLGRVLDGALALIDP